MAVKREFLGEAQNGAPIYAYHISNANGMEAVVLNYGCTIKNIFVPTRDGEKVAISVFQDRRRILQIK